MSAVTFKDSQTVNHKDHHNIMCDGKHSAFENCLPYLHSTLFGCILEDCLTQLHILSECNNKMRILKTNADMGLLRALKFHVKHEGSSALKTIKPMNLGSNQHKLDKLFADRKLFADVLQQTYVDMVLNRGFSSLKASNQEMEDRDEYRAKLAEEETRNRMARRELMRHLRQHRNYIKTVSYDTNLTVEHLRSQVEDTEINSETKSRFVENWQRARTEQHDQTIIYAESASFDTINYYQNKADEENRIHAEVELLVNIFINETLTKVENWMIKYDTDIEDQDLKIAIMKNKYLDAQNIRKEMEETYAARETLMKDWIQFKEDRQQAIKNREKMNNSAIVVQAWWRGLLVRLGIGPYKLARKSRVGKKKK